MRVCVCVCAHMWTPFMVFIMALYYLRRGKQLLPRLLQWVNVKKRTGVQLQFLNFRAVKKVIARVKKLLSMWKPSNGGVAELLLSSRVWIRSTLTMHLGEAARCHSLVTLAQWVINQNQVGFPPGCCKSDCNWMNSYCWLSPCIMCWGTHLSILATIHIAYSFFAWKQIKTKYLFNGFLLMKTCRVTRFNACWNLQISLYRNTVEMLSFLLVSVLFQWCEIYYFLKCYLREGVL